MDDLATSISLKMSHALQNSNSIRSFSQRFQANNMKDVFADVYMFVLDGGHDVDESHVEAFKRMLLSKMESGENVKLWTARKFSDGVSVINAAFGEGDSNIMSRVRAVALMDYILRLELGSESEIRNDVQRTATMMINMLMPSESTTRWQGLLSTMLLDVTLNKKVFSDQFVCLKDVVLHHVAKQANQTLHKYCIETLGKEVGTEIMSDSSVSWENISVLRDVFQSAGKSLKTAIISQPIESHRRVKLTSTMLGEFVAESVKTHLSRGSWRQGIEYWSNQHISETPVIQCYLKEALFSGILSFVSFERRSVFVTASGENDENYKLNTICRELFTHVEGEMRIVSSVEIQKFMEKMINEYVEWDKHILQLDSTYYEFFSKVLSREDSIVYTVFRSIRKEMSTQRPVPRMFVPMGQPIILSRLSHFKRNISVFIRNFDDKASDVLFNIFEKCVLQTVDTTCFTLPVPDDSTPGVTSLVFDDDSGINLVFAKNIKKLKTILQTSTSESSRADFLPSYAFSNLQKSISKRFTYKFLEHALQAWAKTSSPRVPHDPIELSSVPESYNILVEALDCIGRALDEIHKVKHSEKTFHRYMQTLQSILKWQAGEETEKFDRLCMHLESFTRDEHVRSWFSDQIAVRLTLFPFGRSPAMDHIAHVLQLQNEFQDYKNNIKTHSSIFNDRCPCCYEHMQPWSEQIYVCASNHGIHFDCFVSWKNGLLAQDSRAEIDNCVKCRQPCFRTLDAGKWCFKDMFDTDDGTGWFTSGGSKKKRGRGRSKRRSERRSKRRSKHRSERRHRHRHAHY